MRLTAPVINQDEAPSELPGGNWTECGYRLPEWFGASVPFVGAICLVFRAPRDLRVVFARLGEARCYEQAFFVWSCSSSVWNQCARFSGSFLVAIHAGNYGSSLSRVFKENYFIFLLYAALIYIPIK